MPLAAARVGGELQRCSRGHALPAGSKTRGRQRRTERGVDGTDCARYAQAVRVDLRDLQAVRRKLILNGIHQASRGTEPLVVLSRRQPLMVGRGAGRLKLGDERIDRGPIAHG